MVSSFARIKVLNFAIAPILGDLGIAPQGVRSASYMAPERITREPVDERSDIYSLGVLLYECIVGRVPYTCDTPEEIQRAASKSTPLPPSLLISNCPKWLDAFLLRALAASPDNRFPSVASMSQAMGPAAPIRSKRTSAKPVIDSIRQGVERVSSIPSLLFGGASRMFTGLATHLHGALSLAQQKNDSATRSLHAATRSLRRIVTTVNPRMWTKRAAGQIQAWTHRTPLQFRTVSPPAFRIPERLKERLTGFAENNWKRYVVLATLVVSVLIETFIFGGANTLLNPEFNSIPALNQTGGQTGGAQSILEPLNPAATVVEVTADPEPQPKIAKRMNRGTKTSEPTNARTEDLHHEALNSKRTVTYRDADNPSSRAVLQDVRVSEPAKRNPENNTAKVQLNVRWEN